MRKTVAVDVCVSGRLHLAVTRRGHGEDNSCIASRAFRYEIVSWGESLDFLCWDYGADCMEANGIHLSLAISC